MVSVRNCKLLFLDIKIWSAQYLRLSGIIANHTSFCVVDFYVSAACATLITHHSLKYSGVVFECHSTDNKSRGCLMSVGFFGGSGTVSMWMSFTSCSVTSSDTCSCCSLIAFSIDIYCFPGIWTLATGIWFKHCVLNMMSSSSATLHSSSPIDWWDLMTILDTFRASIFSFK